MACVSVVMFIQKLQGDTRAGTFAGTVSRNLTDFRRIGDCCFNLFRREGDAGLVKYPVDIFLILPPLVCLRPFRRG